MAGKSARKKRTSSKKHSKGKHPAGLRDLVCHSNGKGGKRQCWYVKRNPDGSFRTMAKVNRSQRIDKSKAALKKCKSGYCDQGDQCPKGSKKKRKRCKESRKVAHQSVSASKEEGLSPLAIALLVISAILLLLLILFWVYQAQDDDYHDHRRYERYDDSDDDDYR